MSAAWNMDMSIDENVLASTLAEIERLRRKPAPHSPKTAERLAAALRDRDFLTARIRASRTVIPGAMGATEDAT